MTFWYNNPDFLKFCDSFHCRPKSRSEQPHVLQSNMQMSSVTWHLARGQRLSIAGRGFHCEAVIKSPSHTFSTKIKFITSMINTLTAFGNYLLWNHLFQGLINELHLEISFCEIICYKRGYMINIKRGFDQFMLRVPIYLWYFCLSLWYFCLLLRYFAFIYDNF